MSPIETTASQTAEDLLSLEDAAELLCVSKSTLYRMLERNEVKGYKVGRQWRFRRADLETYLQRGPQAVALSAVRADELDALLASLRDVAQRLGIEAPVAGQLHAPDEKLAAYVNHLLRMGIAVGASDVHLVAARESACVQFRIDGVLHEAGTIPNTVYPAVISELKQRAGLNADERGLPQDGRFSLQEEDRRFDLRVNLLPTVFGECLVMRVLDLNTVRIDLDRLGLIKDDEQRLQRWMRTASGLVLVTGPVGSGRTSTLYSLLRQVTGPAMNTVTVEDPVELILPFTRQMAVNKRLGLTFPVALRAFQRHDPDVIMVGDIRDLETAEIIMQAALTGHLVLSNLLPKTAPGALVRLVEMGVEPFMISGAMIGVLAQRLIRRLCPHCREAYELPAEIRAHVQARAAEGGYHLPDDATFFRAVGCDQCWQRGYRGRTGIFELLEFTPAVREAFLRGASAEELMRVAVQDGMHTLIADGIRKAAEGITTIEEVMRVTV